MTDSFLSNLLTVWGERVEKALSRYLPDPATQPVVLHQAMRYAVLGGGKRIRPALFYATAAALDSEGAVLDAPACAVELIHAYSLVHDDLPSMDDDDLRRGRPTCHRAYDEATAILAGDALQTLAFQILAEQDPASCSPATAVEMMAILARASGSRGMAGGQALDMEATGQAGKMDLPQLRFVVRPGRLAALSRLRTMEGMWQTRQEGRPKHFHLGALDLPGGKRGHRRNGNPNPRLPPDPRIPRQPDRRKRRKR